MIIPNHRHALLYPTQGPLNKLTANGKRFMAYEMVKRLEQGKLSDVFSIVELIRDAALNNQECKIPIYSHTVIDNIYDIASDKTIKEDMARRYSGLKFQIQFDESSIEKKVCTFNFDDVEIQAYDLSQTNPAYDFQSSVSIVTKDENKRALVTFNCYKSNVALIKEFLFGDVEKDCVPIIEGITKNLNENKEVGLSELSASCAAQIPLETRKKLVNYILDNMVGV